VTSKKIFVRRLQSFLWTCYIVYLPIAAPCKCLWILLASTFSTLTTWIYGGPRYVPARFYYHPYINSSFIT
jgi:hypothetical protein